MSFQSAAPNFTSSSRPRHRSRQTRSYHTVQPATHDTLQNNNLSNSPTQAFKFKTSSLRLPGEISVNLFSLISKFEALDALSLPIKVPSLQPAPLQLSRGSHKLGGGTYASPQKRLSTIFSPRNHSGDRYRSICSEDNLNSAGEDILGEANLTSRGYVGEKVGPGRLHQSKWPRRSGSIRLLGRSRKASSPAAQTAPTSGNRGKAVRDIVRFYDGSTDLFVDSGAFHISSSAHIASFAAVSNGVNTMAKPSVASQVPFTPLSRRLNNDAKPPSVKSTVNSKQTITSTKSKTPVTPTKLSHISIPKRRTLIFGPKIPNSLRFQDSPKKSTTTTSPSTPPKVWTQPDGSPDRGRPLLRKEAALKQSKVSRSTKPDTFQYYEDGRSDALQWPKTRRKPLSINQRNISDKIEAFYRARSLERKPEYSRDFNAGPLLTSLVEQRRDGVDHQNVAKTIQKVECNERKTSNVAKLKKLFESDITAQLSSLEKPGFEVKSQRNTVVTRGEVKKTTSASLSSPPPPPPPQFTGGGSIVSRELFLETKPTDPQPIYVRVGQDKISQPSQTSGRSPPRKRKIIGDKVKMFERTGEREREIELRLTDGTLTKGIGKSTTGMHKDLFEKPLLGQNEGCDVMTAKRGLSGAEVKEIVDEFQDTEIIGKPGKRGIVIGRWNTIVPQPLIIAPKGFQAVTPAGIDGSGTDSLQEMVVKEAQCGLKEPKPLRIVEMRRLTLLCREKAPKSQVQKGACSRNL